MVKVLKSDRRTIQAIKNADQIKKIVGGGKFRKGTLPIALGVGDAYEGHFKVTDSSDEDETEVTISAGKLVLGLNTVDVPEDTLIIDETGYVYLDVEYDAGYSVEPALLATWPGQTIDSYAIILAYVTYTAPTPPATVGVINSIEQLHYGVHYGAGRVF